MIFIAARGRHRRQASPIRDGVASIIPIGKTLVHSPAIVAAPAAMNRSQNRINQHPEPFDDNVVTVESIIFSPRALMHAAAMLSFAALAFRDQLKIRTALLFSILLSIIYHLVGKSGPSWDEVFWNIVTFGINIKVLTQIILDRTHIGLNAEEMELFSAFGAVTPGEFRSLMKVGVWKTAGPDTIITTKGVTPDHLFYVLNGSITVKKDSRTLSVAPKTFIGEVAFLHETPASATVSLQPGSRYIEWPVASLRKRIASKQALTNSVMRLIGLDMALKIARS